MKNLLFFIYVIVFVACSAEIKKEIEMPYTNADFDAVVDGKSTRLFKMENKNGMVVSLTNYGA